jgi:hypothetical protein
MVIRPVQQMGFICKPESKIESTQVENITLFYDRVLAFLNMPSVEIVSINEYMMGAAIVVSVYWRNTK